jgi:predicted component of type VI protein secretion system
MKRNILKDLEDAQFEKEQKLRDRERIHTDNNAFL